MRRRRRLSDPVRERTRRRQAVLRAARTLYAARPREITFLEFRHALATELAARREWTSLMGDPRFRRLLEQMRRGERDKWPDEDCVDAAPGADWGHEV